MDTSEQLLLELSMMKNISCLSALLCLTGFSFWVPIHSSVALPNVPDREATRLIAAATPASSRPSLIQINLEDIQQQLPPRWVIRLPSQRSLNLLTNNGQNELSLRIFSFAEPAGLMLNFFHCESGLPECLVATIALDSLESEEAQQRLRQHRSGYALSLTDSIMGYGVDTHQQDRAIASVMWQQDGLFYTVRVPTQYRDSLSEIVQTMAIAPPLAASRALNASSNTELPRTSEHALLDSVRPHIPPDWAIQLPSNILSDLALATGVPHHLRVFAFDDPPGVTLSLFRCNRGEPSCLSGSLSIDSASASDVLSAYRRHQSGRAIALSESVQAYAMATQSGDRPVTSVMWQDSGLIYTVSFPSADSEYWMAIAQSTAQAPQRIAHQTAPQMQTPEQSARATSQFSQQQLSQSMAPSQENAPSSGAANGANDASGENQAIAPEPDFNPQQTATNFLSNSSPRSATRPNGAAPVISMVPHRNPAQARPVFSSDDLGQVTSVFQLSDVEPTDWAFQALQALVERYGCISGYPEGTYRGDRSLTRYEFAAGLNACMDRISELFQQGLNNTVSREDLASINRLQEEFAAELMVIQGQVADLQARAEQLEAQQFSTTVRLFGASTMAVAAAGGGDPPGTGEGLPIFAQQTQLNLIGSLTEGRDLLRVGLSAANFGDGGFASPDSLNTSMALLSFQSDTNNDFEISSLEYRFSALDDRIVFTVQPIGFDLSSVLSPNSPLSSSTQEAISRFSEESPLFRIGALEAGVGLDWLASNRVRVQAAYGSRGASDPDLGFGGSGRNTLGVQVLFTPIDQLVAGVGYINGFARDGRLATGTGSFNADTSGNFDEFARIHAVNGTLQWNITDRLTFGAWGGLAYTRSMESEARAGSSTYAASLSLQDVVSEGDLLAFFYGQPLRLFTGSLIERVDDGRSQHFELFYRFRLNDHISLTPGVFYVTDPGHIEENDDIVIGLLRTTFQF